MLLMVVNPAATHKFGAKSSEKTQEALMPAAPGAPVNVHPGCLLKCKSDEAIVRGYKVPRSSPKPSLPPKEQMYCAPRVDEGAAAVRWLRAMCAPGLWQHLQTRGVGIAAAATTSRHLLDL
jgi:hypothetical protein